MAWVGDAGARQRMAALGYACALLIALALPCLALAARGGHPRRDGCAGADRPAVSVSADAMRNAVVCLVNRERARYHLPPLVENPRLALAAQRYASEMARRHFVSHTGPGGSTPGSRIAASGYRWSWFAENIARGPTTPLWVVTIWMDSGPHCRNILAPVFVNIGVGVVASDASTIWTQDYALPRGAAPPSGNWGPAKSCPHAPEARTFSRRVRTAADPR